MHQNSEASDPGSLGISKKLDSDMAALRYDSPCSASTPWSPPPTGGSPRSSCLPRSRRRHPFLFARFAASSAFSCRGSALPDRSPPLALPHRLPRASTHPLAVLLRSILHYRRLCAHALAPTEELRWGGLLLSTLLCAPVRLDAAACAYMGFTDSWLGGEGKKQCLTP